MQVSQAKKLKDLERENVRLTTDEIDVALEFIEIGDDLKVPYGRVRSFQIAQITNSKHDEDYRTGSNTAH